MINVKKEMEYTKTLMNDMSVDLVTDYAGCYTCISDAISEHADGCTSIYYDDIKKFISEHADEVDEHVEMFGWPGDLYKAGQGAEYIMNENMMYSDVDNIIKLSALDFISTTKTEISAEKWEEIQAELDGLGTNHSFADIDEVVREIMTA